MIQIDDKELEQETRGMRIYGWESRNLGKGRKKLYIRMEPIVRPIKIAIHRARQGQDRGAVVAPDPRLARRLRSTEP